MHRGLLFNLALDAFGQPTETAAWKHLKTGEMPEEWKDLYNEAFHSFDQNGDGLPLDGLVTMGPRPGAVSIEFSWIFDESRHKQTLFRNCWSSSVSGCARPRCRSSDALGSHNWRMKNPESHCNTWHAYYAFTTHLHYFTLAWSCMCLYICIQCIYASMHATTSIDIYIYYIYYNSHL